MKHRVQRVLCLEHLIMGHIVWSTEPFRVGPLRRRLVAGVSGDSWYRDAGAAQGRLHRVPVSLDEPVLQTDPLVMGSPTDKFGREYQNQAGPVDTVVTGQRLIAQNDGEQAAARPSSIRPVLCAAHNPEYPGVPAVKDAPVACAGHTKPLTCAGSRDAICSATYAMDLVSHSRLPSHRTLHEPAVRFHTGAAIPFSLPVDVS